MAKDYDAIREDMVDWAIIAGCLILYGCVTSYRRFRIFWRLGRSEDAEVRDWAHEQINRHLGRNNERNANANAVDADGRNRNR